MDRRAFLWRFGLGAVASGSLPWAIAACSSQPTEPQGEAPKSPTAAAADFTTVGSLKDLDKAGFIEDKKFAAGPLLVVRDAADATKLIAVNATCTHQGCVVGWSANEKSFLCPCHASKFKPDGSTAGGPASKPLKTFEVKTEGDSILVKGA